MPKTGNKGKRPGGPIPWRMLVFWTPRCREIIKCSRFPIRAILIKLLGPWRVAGVIPLPAMLRGWGEWVFPSLEVETTLTGVPSKTTASNVAGTEEELDTIMVQVVGSMNGILTTEESSGNSGWADTEAAQYCGSFCYWERWYRGQTDEDEVPGSQIPMMSVPRASMLRILPGETCTKGMYQSTVTGTWGDANRTHFQPWAV